MEYMLVVNAKHLRRPTAFGIKKVFRNILALQQVLKTLTDDEQESEFEHAKEYFSLFFITPQVGIHLLSRFPADYGTQEMLDSIRNKQSFTFEDYRAMLNLQCGADQGEAIDRNYSMYLLDLQALDIEHIDES
jgi:exocyst complex component 4